LKAVEDLVSDPLAVPGDLFNFVADFWESLRREAAGKKDDCSNGNAYYTTHFAICYSRGVFTRLDPSSGYGDFENNLNHACRQRFSRCVWQNQLSGICDPMRHMFRRQSVTLERSLNDSARAYTRHFALYLDRHRAQLCAMSEQEIENRFARECAQSLRIQIQLAGNPTDQACKTPSQSVSPSAHLTACKAALQGIDVRSIRADVCDPPPKTVPGTTYVVLMVPITCEYGMVPNAANTGCQCPANTEQRGNACVPVAAHVEQCPADTPVGSFPNCCPRGRHFARGGCQPDPT
jgi:hypothetical protein